MSKNIESLKEFKIRAFSVHKFSFVSDVLDVMFLVYIYEAKIKGSFSIRTNSVLNFLLYSLAECLKKVLILSG